MKKCGIMVKQNKKPTYEEYLNTLIFVPLNVISEEKLNLFKKTRGNGQFILKSDIDGELVEERWIFYEFEEGTNFNNFTKDSKVKCRPVCADRKKNLLSVFYDKKGTINVDYRARENAKINIKMDDNHYNQFNISDSIIPGNLNLKVGLYLQTVSFKNLSEFNKYKDLFDNDDLDILVFPEFCFTSFTVKFKSKDIFNLEQQQEIMNCCLEFSKSINKAVVVCSDDANNVIFSVYANANASEEETLLRVYIKHTKTDNSPFYDENYEKNIENLFTPIKYKDYLIGLTICFDCNHAPFSRMYGLQNVDVILNSTGGDVVYDKWYKYNKARATENNCFNLVTMGGWNEENKTNITYGFNPNGGLILPINNDNDEKPSKPGKIYIYDLSSCSLDSTPERRIDQKQTISKIKSFEFPVGKSSELLDNSEKIKENIYVHPVGKYNVIFIVIDGNNIFKPEKVIPLLYCSDLKNIENKKYIIINRHETIDNKFYTDKLSNILKVRAIENFCTVILESDSINMCYQPTDSKTLQVVKAENDKYGIDLDRAGGPEAIWQNKEGMCKNWRTNFEKLLNFMVEKTS